MLPARKAYTRLVICLTTIFAIALLVILFASTPTPFTPYAVLGCSVAYVLLMAASTWLYVDRIRWAKKHNEPAELGGILYPIILLLDRLLGW